MSALSEIMRYGRQMELQNLREHSERSEKYINRLRENNDRMSNELMIFHNLKVILEDELDKETLDRIYKRLNKND